MIYEPVIHIMKTVSDKCVNAKLLLIGAGDDEKKIRILTEKLGLGDRVIFYGTSDKVNELMQAMDIFVLPSRFEGLPIVGVEAQAAGLPVIFSDKITRSVALTDNSFFCPITDKAIGKWAELIESSANKNIDRYFAYKVLKDKSFDIDDTVNSFLSLYT